MAIAAALEDHLVGVEVTLPETPRADATHRLRLVVFMTDGDVAGAEAVLRTAKSKLCDTRIHVIGIGDSVHHGMLAALASAGGGAYTPVSTNEDLEQAITRLKNAMSAPLWTSIRVWLESGGERRMCKQLEPEGPMDLFAGEPLLIGWRGPVAAGDRVVLEGQRQGGEDLRLVAPLAISGASGAADATAPANEAALVWALLRSHRLTYRFDEADEATLEALGTSHGLVNRAVALIGVDSAQRDVEIEGSVAVSLPMPGNIADAGGFPRGARLSPMMAAGMVMGGALPGMAMPAAFAAPPPPPCPSPARPPARHKAQGRVPATGAPGPMAKGHDPEAKMDALGFQDDPPGVYYCRDIGLQAPAAELEASPPLSDDESGLRSLLLAQGADGLFAGDVGLTLVAVAALVARGHSAREGLFRAELRRTVQTLRKRLPTFKSAELAWAALALAVLLVPYGDPVPFELPPAIAGAFGTPKHGDESGLRAALRAALKAAPPGWDAHPLAAEAHEVFFP